MPLHHGLDVKRGDTRFERPPAFVLGVRKSTRIFCDSRFHPNQGNFVELIRRYEIHLHRTIQFLLFSLQSFQERMVVFDNQCQEQKEAECPSAEFIGHAIRVNLEANMMAASIFVWLSVFADDIGRFIGLIGGLENDEKIDSFSRVKKLAEKEDGLLAEFRQLFRSLDDDLSWYHICIKRGVGLRQRVVHYPDTLEIACGKGPNEVQFRAHAFHWRKPDNTLNELPTDVVQLISAMLDSLCEWLDQLMILLDAKLRSRDIASDRDWDREAAHSRIPVPLAWPEGRFEFPDNFLYLPLCEGSDPFNGTGVTITT